MFLIQRCSGIHFKIALSNKFLLQNNLGVAWTSTAGEGEDADAISSPFSVLDAEDKMHCTISQASE
ncbi:hypothetical protein NE237_024467 [Protea cynaroides]|uniref:Uncharacterized protein n=1 Tax=Protea cynaroides TaxID=273540 RepID=A0A9Q0JSU7_9MAGN|nr:hypothetical protein NE237_024467 [Protea cynaroides]